ncbi:MAG: cobalamin-dependent protein, partial [Polyangiales bacterium]
MRVLLISANREKLPSPVVPLGVLAVAGAVRAAGHEVRVVDLCFVEDVQSAVVEALSFSPDVVGIGLRNLHSNAYDGTEALVSEYSRLVALVRERTRATIVLGGAGFSLQPKRLLERLGGDHGIVGEGERAFVSLLDALDRGEQPPPLIDASAVRPAFASIALRTGVASPVALADLDLLPPPTRDLTDPAYFLFDGTDSIQSKRGCAFQCSYCDYPDLEGRKVRVRDPGLVADEVAARARVPGVTHAFFVDSVFNVPPAHARAICDALIARGTPLPWVCYGSPVAFDDGLVAAMVRA